MMKRNIWIAAVIGASYFLAGCQPTPGESAVVSKAEGLNETVIAQPLEEGQTRVTDIPKHWQMKELKNKDRMMISADLDLEEKEIGNLPVIEMKNHKFTEEELNVLTDYFADGEALYVPQPYTKSTYANVISRIENKEGIYAASYSWLQQLKVKQSAETGMEIAKENADDPEAADVKFGQRFVDAAFEAAFMNRIDSEGYDLYENREENIWFEADVGENREAHIKAQTYDPKVRNSSSFQWTKGAEMITYTEMESRKLFFGSQSENPFTSQVIDRINQFEAYYENDTFDWAEGEAQAEQVLEDLQIDGMSLASKERVLWFSDTTYPKGELRAGESDDLYWLADPAEAEFGYQYTFSRAIGGLHVMDGDTAVIEQTEEMYSPAFPAETITITVTGSGVKSFAWEGMAEEVKTITENTKLLPFEKIQNRLQEQIFYWYSGVTQGQPEDDPTQFVYRITKADLGYTYITAYKAPDHAWLVPAWKFQVVEGYSEKEFQFLPYMIEALEGRVIVKQ